MWLFSDSADLLAGLPAGLLPDTPDSDSVPLAVPAGMPTAAAVTTDTWTLWAAMNGMERAFKNGVGR